MDNGHVYSWVVHGRLSHGKPKAWRSSHEYSRPMDGNPWNFESSGRLSMLVQMAWKLDHGITECMAGSPWANTEIHYLPCPVWQCRTRHGLVPWDFRGRQGEAMTCHVSAWPTHGNSMRRHGISWSAWLIVKIDCSPTEQRLEP